MVRVKYIMVVQKCMQRNALFVALLDSLLNKCLNKRTGLADDRERKGYSLAIVVSPCREMLFHKNKKKEARMRRTEHVHYGNVMCSMIRYVIF